MLRSTHGATARAGGIGTGCPRPGHRHPPPPFHEGDPPLPLADAVDPFRTVSSSMPEPTPRIESVQIEGFRSLREVTFRPNPGVTVLVGPNGAGKSNLLHFFHLLRSMVPLQRLGRFVAFEGGANDQLFHGRHRTPEMKGEISIRTGAGRNEYAFTLNRGRRDQFFFAEERYRFSHPEDGADVEWRHLGSGHDETRLLEAAQPSEDARHRGAARTITDFLQAVTSYQFQDTSKNSPFTNRCHVTDSFRLWPNGGNLAAVLYRMQREDERRYEELCGQIGWIFPVFERFAIEEENEYVILRWRARNSDQIIGAHLTSDGALRFFALMALLILPSTQLPNVILLDEPELGLHPEAIALVAGMIRSLATERQIVIATQSPLLVDEFGLEDLRVLDLKDGETVMKSVNPDEYRVWLDDYGAGGLWMTNLLGGNP